MELTKEQERVASSPAQTLLVNAFAGTGKTSVLVEYAKRRPGKRMIYLAFNRSIKEEAAKRFPPNVRAVTTHGLAFPQFGSLYQKKLGNPKASHIGKALQCDVLTGGYVLAVIMNYLSSPDLQISGEHAIPVAPKAEMRVIHDLVEKAKRAWLIMQQTGNAAVPMPHDGYLKLYQLSNPVIRTDTILFDEAQDANPVTLDFVLRQSCNKVIVGDRYQSIYGFRGAVDALSRIQGDESLLISESFRFGEGVAEIASGLLYDWRGEKNSVKGKGSFPTVFAVNQNTPHAIISRTNGQLFGEAVSQVVANRPFGFAGGVEGYRFDQILDVYRLFAKRNLEIRDQFIASFEDFGVMRQYAEELDDKEIKSLANVVEEYRHDIPDLIDKIRARAVPSLTGQEVALSTAHKSKGLQWMDVVLTEDYADLEVKRDKKTNEPISPNPEEINVIYVAATRAQRGLQLPSTIRNWLAESGRTTLLNRLNKDSPAPLVVSTSKTMLTLNQRFTTIGEQVTALQKEVAAFPQAARSVASFFREQAAYFEQLAELQPQELSGKNHLGN